jgi:hypothetical protein
MSSLSDTLQVIVRRKEKTMTLQDIRRAEWPLRETHCIKCNRPKRVEDKDFWEWVRTSDGLLCPKHALVAL